MLERRERVKSGDPTHHARLFAESKETLEQLLVRVGAIKVKSYLCTPETKPSQPTEQIPAMKI